jgi:hypothetical protein
LQAITSPWADWVNIMQERHISNEFGLAHVLEWDTKRGRDFQCLANFIYCCDGLPKQMMPTHQKMEKFLARPDEPLAAFKHAINEVMTEFYYIATERKLYDAFKKITKRLAPVEFVFIGSYSCHSVPSGIDGRMRAPGVLLFMLRQAPHEDRARAVYNLRNYVRKEHVDIRSNTTVAKTMWHFISVVARNPSGSHAIDGFTPAAKGKKRRKAKDDSPSDEEYRPNRHRR